VPDVCRGNFVRARAAALLRRRRSKGGGVEYGPRIFNQPTCHHAPEIYPGIGEERASQILKVFFQARR
jgi:tRNA(Arg) A34 adenosine deaminase TadA